MLGLLALLASAHATDVLFVEATPVTLDDFSVAGLFYGMVLSAAEEEGLDHEDADAIRRWAGADADTCWDNDMCPANLWDRTDARLAVVMSVGQEGGGLVVEARLHGVDEVAPFKTLRETVLPGQESDVAARIARAAADALPLLPPRKPAGGPVLVIEDEVVPGPPRPAAEPDEDLDDEEPAEDEVAAVDRDLDAEPDRVSGRADADRGRSTARGDAGRADRGRTDTGRTDTGRDPRAGRDDRDERVRARFSADEERRAMGVPAGAYARYEASGLSKQAWLDRARVRAGHAFFELSGGYGLGDVNRGYGVRLRIEESGNGFDTVATSTWEGAGAGAAPTFGFTLGYAPAWFLDTSVSVAVQYGDKHLDTGWECLNQCDPPASEFTHDPVGAVQAFVEPRLRVYPVATGVVKPYALVGFSVLLHDGFQVPDPEFVDYPDTEAGAAFGPTAGLGLAVDAVSRVSIFAEVPATLLLSAERAASDGDVTLDPGRLESGGYVVRFVGGVAFRL